MPADPTRETAIRLVYRSLSQAAEPLPGDALVEAIAEQTGAQPHEIEEVIDREETP